MMNIKNLDPLFLFYNRSHALFSKFSSNIHDFVAVLLEIISEDFKADRLGLFVPMISSVDKIEYVLCGLKSSVEKDRVQTAHYLPEIDLSGENSIIETPTKGVGWDAYLVSRHEVTKQVLAVLAIDDTASERKFNQKQRRLMSLIILLLQAIFNEMAKLQELIYNDQLTGLLNQRGYQYEIDKINAERRRDMMKIMSVAAIDIDDFKARINSVFGEPFGNIVLKTFAQVLKDHLRGYDIICRWGGDEFLCIFKDQLGENIINRIKGILNYCQNMIIKDGNNRLEGISFSGAVLDVPAGASMAETEKLVFDLKKQAKKQKKPCLLLG